MNPEEFPQHALDVALARYAVIAPLVSRNLTPPQFHQEAQRILACSHQFPGQEEKRISARHLRRWVKWYREGRQMGGQVLPAGVEALKPVHRSDQGKTRVLDPEVVEQAVRLRAEEPSRTTATLIQLLRAQAEARDETPPRLEEATLAYHLRRRAATRKALHQVGRAYPRYEHAYRNAVWQGDFCDGILLPNPVEPGKLRKCYLHVFLDDHTRYVPHGEFYWRQNLPCLEDCFRKALLKSGRPERCYVDNGAVYQARQVKLLAARLGIQVIFATPYAPQGKGKIERFFKTAQESFYPEARRAGIKTLEELNTFFWAWLESHYHSRVHSETLKTPKERWEAGEAQVVMPDPSTLGDIFLWEETRQVDKAGCVHLSGNSYPVGEHLVGEKVSVRFDPFDLSRVRLYHRGVFVEAVGPQELVSHTYRKALPRRIEHPAPLESATTYREQLSRGYRRELEALVHQVRRPDSFSNDNLTRQELAQEITQVLGGRELTVAEGGLVADFFTRSAPLGRSVVRQALLRAVEAKGTRRHLRFYLDALRHAKLGQGGVV